MKKIKFWVLAVLFLEILGTQQSAHAARNLKNSAIIEEEAQVKELEVSIKAQNRKQNRLILEWKALKTAAYYVIYQKKNDTWEEILTTQNTKGKMTWNTPGKTECFRVVAFDRKDCKIGRSKNIRLAFPMSIQPPTTTSTSSSYVQLQWEIAGGANRYEIYRQESGKKREYVKTTKKTRIKVAVKQGKAYTFYVVPYSKSGNCSLYGEETKVSFFNGTIVNIKKQKYTYRAMKQDIRKLCEKYHDYVKVEKIGESTQGRDIYDVILGNPDAKKSVLVVSAIHAREYVTTVTCMQQLEYYLKNYNRTVDGAKIADTFENRNIHYVMMANPDGVTISQTKKATWKANANGVNLNGNFDVDFLSYGYVWKGNYTGRYPESEKETQAIVKLTKELEKNKSLIVVNYHAMGEIVFGDTKGLDKKAAKMTRRMYWSARRTTGYADCGSYGNGGGNGNYREYVMYKLNTPCITIEVGDEACPVGYRRYHSVFLKNRLVLLRQARLL